MNEFIEQFLIESRELVEQTTDDLLALEQAPEDQERLNSAFRGFHTLKGAAGIVGFDAMGRVVHAAEDVLTAVRAGNHPITLDLISSCLVCLGQITQWLKTMEESAGADAGEPPPGSDAAADKLVARLAARDTLPQVTAEFLLPASDYDLPAHASLITGRTADILKAQIALMDSVAGEGLAGRLGSVGRVAKNVLLHLGLKTEAARIDTALAESLSVSKTGPLVHALEALLNGSFTSADGRNPAQPHAPQTTTEIAARALRVDVERIDALVKLTGELTVVKNAVGHIAQLAQNGDDLNHLAKVLKQQHAMLDRLMAELQQSVLAIRVLPLRHVFQRFPQLVREMSNSLGKKARLITEGDTTEADKAVVEALFEPLLHVLRNAVDHGVETAEQRITSGKPEAATIRLTGHRQGEHVMVEVSDDGRGIDPAQIRRLAAERGVHTQEALAALSDNEVIDLIFAPGFSTSTAITDFSGRGVGMDAVRTAVERLGGRVTVSSRFGTGTSVQFTLPFTVMMTKVMIVDVAGQAFGVPFETVVETLQLPRDKIIAIGAAQAFILRGRTIPLVNLAQLLALDCNIQPAPVANILVTDVGGQLGAIEVDRFGQRLDVMLKSMDGLLSGMAGVAGTTLLGDGRVLVVLDLQVIMQ